MLIYNSCNFIAKLFYFILKHEMSRTRIVLCTTEFIPCLHSRLSCSVLLHCSSRIKGLKGERERESILCVRNGNRT